MAWQIEGHTYRNKYAQVYIARTWQIEALQIEVRLVEMLIVFSVAGIGS